MEAISRLTTKSAIHRHLDPGETLAETLFGLIMALTIITSAGVLSGTEGLNSRKVIAAAIGCNVAWGVIDATLFVLGNLFYRSQRARFFRQLRSARSEIEALTAIQKEFSLEEEPLAVPAEDRTHLYQAILGLGEHARPARAGLRRRDIQSALIIFFMVSITALPGVVPFLLLDDPYLALRVSSAVLILLLFGAGYWWAHYTDARPWRVAMIVLFFCVLMVVIADALGG
jgi:VIT1/CCC1 family predicted Fe2+/Mn2+ transporter